MLRWVWLILLVSTTTSWSSSSFKQDTDLYREVCHDTLIQSDSPDITRLASQLKLKTETLQEVIDRLRKTTYWHMVEGLFIYGSRAHQYWGKAYDLDIMLLPNPRDSRNFTTYIWEEFSTRDKSRAYAEINRYEFYTKYGFRIDLGNSSSVTAHDLLDRKFLITKESEKLFLAKMEDFIS